MSRKPEFSLSPLFVTELYRAEIADEALIDALDDACRGLADDDEAGQNWSQEKGYLGYTSYASLNDLPARDSLFNDLKTHLDRHVNSFAEALEYDLGGRKLKLNSLWVNILEPMGHHSNHIHPHSVISGTFYVHVPAGSAALKLEDPRLDRFMNAPPRKADARPEHKTFVSAQPEPGTVLLWESWLRHEVPINLGEDIRISISFNYG